MSDNTELTEAEIMSLYNDIVEGPDYLAAAKSCPSNLKKVYGCGTPYWSGVNFSCCTYGTTCKDGKITSGGGCTTIADSD